MASPGFHLISSTIPARVVRYVYAGVALVWCFAQFLPLYTGGYEYDIVLLGTHVGSAVAVALMVNGFAGARRRDGEGVPLLDMILVGAVLACTAYFVSQGQRVAERTEGVDAVYALDYVAGIAFIAVLLEACRRAAGTTLMLVGAAFIVYVFTGPVLPDVIAHRGMSLKRFVDLQVVSTSGMFGTPVSASANMVFYFVLVGAFLERSGAGKLFVDIAYGVTKLAGLASLVAVPIDERDVARIRAEVTAPGVGQSMSASFVSAGFDRELDDRLNGLFAAMTMPVLFLQGARDPGQQPHEYETVVEAVHDGYLQFVDSGHFCHLETPDEVSAAIRSFLTRTDLPR